MRFEAITGISGVVDRVMQRFPALAGNTASWLGEVEPDMKREITEENCRPHLTCASVSRS